MGTHLSRLAATFLVVLAGALLAACGSSSSSTTATSASTPTAHTSAAPSAAVWVASLPNGPVEVPLTTGGRVVVTGLSWSAWGAATATSSGELQLTEPTKQKVYPVHVEATAIKSCRGQRAYTSLKIKASKFGLKIPLCGRVK